MSAVIYAGVGDYRVTRPFDSYSGVIKPLLINGDTTNCIILSGIVDTVDSEEEVKNMLPEGLGSNQRLIYVHVGKTGGTTLAYVLRSNCYWYGDIERKKTATERWVAKRNKDSTR
jgi:hypothetical protein